MWRREYASLVPSVRFSSQSHPPHPLPSPSYTRNSLRASMKEKSPARWPGSHSPTLGCSGLLQVCGGAGFLQPRDPLFGVGLADVLQHRLRRGVDQVLGLFQAELGQLADRLDHVDLAVADRGQGDGELRLLLRRFGCRAGRRGRGHGRHGCRGLDAELVLDGLSSLDDVENAPVLQGFDEILRCELGCHLYAASNLVRGPREITPQALISWGLIWSCTPRAFREAAEAVSA